MRQPKYISKLRLGLLLFFIFPLKSFSQDISGVWVGYMYNDTTQETIHYELAINDVNGKTSGFSHTTFIIDGVKNIGVKEVKVKEKNDRVYVEDEKFVYDNYGEPAAKGVKMFSFLTLSENDSSEVLSGIWRTNATRKYNPLTGSIFLEKKKKVEPRQTIIVKKLIDLGFADQLAFLPPLLSSQNTVAVNSKIDRSQSSSSELENSLAKQKLNAPENNSVAGNEKTVAVNESNSSPTNHLSASAASEKKNPDVDKNDPQKQQSGVVSQNRNASEKQVPSKQENEKTVALNQRETSPETKDSPVAGLSAGTEKANDKSVNTTTNASPEATGSKERNVNNRLAINEKKELSTMPASGNTNSSAVSQNTSENSPQPGNNKTVNKANADDVKTLQENKNKSAEKEVATTQLTNPSVQQPAPDKNVTAAKKVNTNEMTASDENRNESAEKKAAESQKTNSVEPQPTVDKNNTNANSAKANDLIASNENKNQTGNREVVTNQKANAVVAQSTVDNNDKVSPSSREKEKSKENVTVPNQQNQKTVEAQPNEAGKITNQQTEAGNENVVKKDELKQPEPVNQQKKAEINSIASQQKPNSQQAPVVVKPKVILPVAAAELSKRKLETIRTVDIAEDSLTFSLYDNGSIDGDTVSVLVNGKVIMPRVGLLASSISKTVYLTPDMGDSISVVMYAENLGSIPPNTGLLVIHDGAKIYEIRFSGDLNKNSKIILVRKKKT